MYVSLLLVGHDFMAANVSETAGTLARVASFLVVKLHSPHCCGWRHQLIGRTRSIP